MKRLFSVSDHKICGLKPEIWAGILALFAALCGICALGVFPFGTRSLLYSDAYWQYVEFLGYFRDTVLSGRSLLYSWDYGMGFNTLGLIAYYLSSPVTLVTLLFPRELMIDAFTLIVLIKIFLSAVSFCFFARRVVRSGALFSVVFAISYSLMGFMCVFFFNIMWLDGLIWLPLIIFFIEKILAEGKCAGYVISLAMMLISSMYISFMIGIFAVLYFFAAFLRDHTLGEWRKGVRPLLMFAVSSLVALGISAFITMPTFYVLMTCGGSKVLQKLPKWGSRFPFIDMLSMLLPGAYNSIYATDSMPHIYSGTFALLAMPFYFSNRKIPVRERAVFGALMVIMAISLNSTILYVVWHGFGYPAMLPYRYSFIFSFLILLCAARALNTEWRKIASGLLPVSAAVIFLCFLAQKFSENTERYAGAYVNVDVVYFTGITVTLAATTLWIYLKKPKLRENMAIVLLGLVVVESSMNFTYQAYNISQDIGASDRASYNDKLRDHQAAARFIKDMDRGVFYRTETRTGFANNMPLAAGFHGISVYSSTADSNLINYMSELGVLVGNSVHLRYDESTPLLDAIFGVRYFIAPEDARLPSIYKKTIFDGEYGVLRNPLAMPLAFQVDAGFAETALKGSDPVELQRDILNAMEPGAGDCIVDIDKTVNTVNVRRVAQPSGARYEKTAAGSQEAYIEYELDIEKSAMVYAYFDASTKYDAKMYFNGVSVDSYFTPSIKSLSSFITALGNVKSSDEGILKLDMDKTGEMSFESERFIYFDTERLSAALDRLRGDAPEITRITDGHVSMDAVFGNGKMLFTSIPYDAGWTLKVDGAETEITPVMGGRFIGIEAPPGEHRLELSYIPPWFSVSAVISVVCVLLLAAYVFFRENGKPTKKEGFAKNECLQSAEICDII